MQDNKTLSELVHARRSVRKYDSSAQFNHDDVQKALELALLSPNSSNMQLWKFHRVISEEVRAKIAHYCMGQNAAKTANELVVITTTPQYWRERAELNAQQVRDAFEGRDDAIAKRALQYYDKLIPTLYNNDKLGVRGLLRQCYSWWVGRNKPMVREVSKADLRVCLHKSTSLASMTFMLAMQDMGYDTCPMEGFDSKRIKAELNLSQDEEITMVISCGVKAEDGIYSARHRIPSSQVITQY
ncbi:nitroreductase family protein [Vibrio astriarenae]|jgi:nitroreductase